MTNPESEVGNLKSGIKGMSLESEVESGMPNASLPGDSVIVRVQPERVHHEQ